MSSGFKFPQEKITVNLGPADMRKSGGRFDLPIALGILLASRQVAAENLSASEFFGELALNGALRRVPGILPAAIKAASAGRVVTVPLPNGEEASLAHDQVIIANSLLQVTAQMNEPGQVQYFTPDPPAAVGCRGPAL